jgi:hypothetical protein
MVFPDGAGVRIFLLYMSGLFSGVIIVGGVAAAHRFAGKNRRQEKSRSTGKVISYTRV